MEKTSTRGTCDGECIHYSNTAMMADGSVSGPTYCRGHNFSPSNTVDGSSLIYFVLKAYLRVDVILRIVVISTKTRGALRSPLLLNVTSQSEPLLLCVTTRSNSKTNT